ncbi:MAG: hypothetical protein J6U95_02775 [Alistipes sp.]|nr:hypothetical protein [Alistipes sp.]
MKNLFNYLVAFAAIIMGFAMSACTPDTPEPGAGVSVAVVVDETTAATVSISVKTQGIKEFAYILDKEVAATAILAGGTKVEVDSTEENVTIQNLEPNTSYKAYFAFRQNDGKIYKDVVVAEFTTGSYGDNVLTVVDQRYDGFAVHIQIPDEVKERKNALRYSTSSLPMYNYGKREGSMEIDMLLYNAGQYTTKDKTVRYDEDHNYERDENGNLVENGASFADPKVPGEPGVFLIGEYGYMEDKNEAMFIIDEEGDGVFDKMVSLFDNDGDDLYDNVEDVITPNSKYAQIWQFPAGWSQGYYRPMYDFLAWANERGTDAADDEKYWNGYYEKLYINTLEPETLEGNVNITVTDKTPIDATITFTADEDVIFYNIFICTESEYQTQVLPLLDGNEDYLRWFVGSYFAMMSFGTQVSDAPVSTVHLNAAEWANGWFVDTKGLAGQDIRVMVAGMGDQNGMTQCFNTIKFTMPEVTLPKPEVVITPVESKDPYSVTFNIKNPNWATNPITEAYFACNYAREFDQILQQYSYTELLKSMGNPLHVDQNAMQAINSDAGFNFIMSSRENATTRLALLVYNWEGTGNNPDATGSTAVAEITTPKANYPARVNSELFTTLLGEWEATAPVQKWVAPTETAEGYWESVGTYTSPVTIASGVEYPEDLTPEVYDLYDSWGISRDKTDALFEEFKEKAEEYNNRTRGFNRLLCLGYNFTDRDYNLGVVQTPYDLFISSEFSVATVDDMFYDFGPKWNLEIDEQGNVTLPINIEREFPLSAFYYGIDYTFYMLAIGNSSYMGAPVYDSTGKMVLDSRFPVEVSADGNTITIKPIVYNYNDANGQPAVETYYPCVAQLQYGQATPLNPRVCGDVVLKRKAGAKTASANPAVGKAAVKSVASFGDAPKAMQRTFSVTPLVVEESKVAKPIVRKTPYDNSPEAYHARVRALFKKMYGVEFPAKN